jgi:hypothetical protein
MIGDTENASSPENLALLALFSNRVLSFIPDTSIQIRIKNKERGNKGTNLAPGVDGLWIFVPAMKSQFKSEHFKISKLILAGTRNKVKDVKGNVVSLCFGRQQSKADET